MTGRRRFPTVERRQRKGFEADRADRGSAMQKYIIERTVPGAGQMDAAALAALACASKAPTSSGCTAT